MRWTWHVNVNVCMHLSFAFTSCQCFPNPLVFLVWWFFWNWKRLAFKDIQYIFRRKLDTKLNYVTYYRTFVVKIINPSIQRRANQWTTCSQTGSFSWCINWTLCLPEGSKNSPWTMTTSFTFWETALSILSHGQRMAVFHATEKTQHAFCTAKACVSWVEGTNWHLWDGPWLTSWLQICWPPRCPVSRMIEVTS